MAWSIQTGVGGFQSSSVQFESDADFHINSPFKKVHKNINYHKIPSWLARATGKKLLFLY